MNGGLILGMTWLSLVRRNSIRSLIIFHSGTLDGANIEIREEIGAANMFIFGTTSDKVEEARASVRAGTVKLDPRLEETLDMLQGGTEQCVVVLFF